LFMLPAIAEKLLSSISTLLLYAADRVVVMTAAPAMVDLVLAILFIVAFLRCRRLSDSEVDCPKSLASAAQPSNAPGLARKAAQVGEFRH